MDGEFESLADAVLAALADGSRGEQLLGVYEESRPGGAETLRLRRILSGIQHLGGVDPRERRELARRLADTASVDPDAVSELRTFFPSEGTPVGAVPPVLVRNSVHGGTFTGPVQGAGTQYNYFGQTPYAPLPAVTHWPELGLADPIALGVRRTRRLPDKPPLPPYIGRDCDARLGDQVREAAAHGGLVLVTGEPLSGKTRTAWQAATGNLPGGTRIYTPQPGTDLRGLPAVLRDRGDGDTECVLWLDDLEGHLGGNGLTAAVLAELVQLRTLVIGTMADEAYDAHRFGGSASARVLGGVEPVELSRWWSPQELARFRNQHRDDPRLRRARFGGGGVSVTEYLAVAPELGDLWRRARRARVRSRGHYVVRAAVDLHRCGADAEVPLDVLRRAHLLYAGEPYAPQETFEAGLAWAAEVRLGVTGMLRKTPRDTWRPFGSLVVEAEDQGLEADPVPLKMWLFALEAAGDEERRDQVITRARRYLTPRADGDPDTMTVLGSLEREMGEAAAAESWYRRAADAGSVQAAGVVGALLAGRGADADAEPYLETAAAAGDVAAQSVLARVLGERAELWLTRAAEAGDGEAACRLGELFLGRGKQQTALRWFRRAADSGYEEAAQRIGRLFHDWDELDEAESWYRRAIDRGHVEVANSLALILERKNAPAEEIERLFRMAAESGDGSASVNLGYFARERGDWDEARRWFEAGHAAGSYDGAFARGQLEREQGDTAAAQVWFIKSLAIGHHAAEQAIVELRSEGKKGTANVEG